MSSGRPLWRRGFDRTERTVGRRLEDLVSTQAFTDLLVAAFREENAFYRLFERQTRAVLHFWNMPARSDVAQLRRQVGALRADLRELAAKLEDEQRQRHGDAHTTNTDSSAAQSSQGKP
jgi:hypothetical protein